MARLMGAVAVGAGVVIQDYLDGIYMGVGLNGFGTFYFFGDGAFFKKSLNNPICVIMSHLKIPPKKFFRAAFGRPPSKPQK
jgi:hypothetical protein